MCLSSCPHCRHQPRVGGRDALLTHTPRTSQRLQVLKNLYKMRGFFQMLNKKKELIPLIGIVSLAAMGAATISIYFLLTKSDVILNKTSNPEPWERVDPSKPQKLLTINQQWKPVKELELVKSLTK
ncbi:normal mucosa of esophagus-specific gene 1 protein [Corythoichthys intestinalis]|uniref:normal mucosa of esophagus-specific gene 1 protein n=1 Tax=Corythoichthys intestinalis TaxID=161448 RepID=UPI0025A61573|nr:normal mucosa of esophagus-specific gene 1 protein [Corythoichthys intestinalis]